MTAKISSTDTGFNTHIISYTHTHSISKVSVAVPKSRLLVWLSILSWIMLSFFPGVCAHVCVHSAGPLPTLLMSLRKVKSHPSASHEPYISGLAFTELPFFLPHISISSCHVLATKYHVYKDIPWQRNVLLSQSSLLTFSWYGKAHGNSVDAKSCHFINAVFLQKTVDIAGHFILFPLSLHLS